MQKYQILNNLAEHWEEAIKKANPNSRYSWEKLNDNLLDYEGSDGDDDCDELSTAVDNVAEVSDSEAPPSPSKKLPKRVLAFTSKKLLKQGKRQS